MTTLRVRYGEADRMGFLFHAHYATYYEVGRTESIRELGLSYRAVEDAGVLMPVTDLSIRFLLPARYDEQITITTTFPTLPEWRMLVQAEMHNDRDELINRSEVRLAFLDASTRKICQAPQQLLDKLYPYFSPSH